MLAALAAAGALATAGPAQAGDFHQVICANPETGEPVGGGLPDGMSFYTNDASFSGASQPANACTGPNHRGLALVAQSAGPWNDGAVAAFHYATSPGLVLEEGVIYRYRRADTRFGNRLGSYQHGGAANVDGRIDPTNHAESCNWANPGCFDSSASSGNPAAPSGWNQPSNRVEVVHSGGRWTYNFVCESQEQPTCTPGWSPAHYLYLYGGKMRLREDDDPVLQGTPAGGLRDDAELRGVESLTYSATDGQGAGLYRVRTFVDGALFRDVLVDSNAGRCRDVNPANANPYEYVHQRPCRAAVSDARATLDTTELAEGRHTLSVELVDAARNAVALVPTRTVTVDNVPPPALVEGSQPAVSIDGGRAVAGARARASRGEWTGDGNTYAVTWERCTESATECRAIDGASGEERAISDADVGSRLRVRVVATNPEGSRAATSAPTDVVERAPASSDPEPREVPSGGADRPAAPSDPAPAGTPAGVASARLTAAARGATVLRFGEQTEIAGRLTDEAGAGIAGAQLDVVAALRRAGATPSVVGTATTAADGTYRWRVPAGASRTVRVGYRARPGDAGYAAIAEVELRVRGAARLAVTPRAVRNGQRVTFSGRLLGDLPVRAISIVLEARVGRRWQPFARVRSGRRGAFRARYRFRSTRRTTTYAFRAVIPRDAEWPYEGGDSNRVRVKVRGR